MSNRRTATPADVADPTSEVLLPELGFVASTGRTATMFLATTLDSLPAVTAFHEGHQPGEAPTPRLPLINLQNRQAWNDPGVAGQVVSERRSRKVLAAAASAADLVVDVGFYNAPLLEALAAEHPTAHFLTIYRRCASFVRSATILEGEDTQPAGWPDPSKLLTDRERFIELGRLRPRPGTEAADLWPLWSAIQRNIWLWWAVNSHLLAVTSELPDATALFFEALAENPERFWSRCLNGLGLDRPGDLERCVERSNRPMNARPGYQVGPVESWEPAERRLYERLAIPLEKQIYGQR